MTEQKKNTLTRAQALESALYLVKLAINETANTENSANWEEVEEVLHKMHASITKSRKATTSKARLMNENLARKVYDAVEDSATSKEIANLGIAEISSSQKATAVTNVAVDLGLFTKTKDGKCITYTKVAYSE
jgi:hypothetical protein